ncbi:hypothetical protein [Paramagnetospirillum kuznetsovii]|uniref:hypothetical protein n=1 Tax=Paramagnetospirillum kuznetsovii TaxID=2053833 RepID=UPI0011BF60C8|nr:hypothetical protein [Paramagnetospirillum kuznetsovii]
MDRNICVRFFTVERSGNNAIRFGDALRQIAGIMDLANRELEVEPEVILRLEKLRDERGMISGEFVRRQTQNLPSRAPHGEPISRLGVDSIGHSTAFAYNPDLSIIALQLARNGVTPMRVMLYVSNILNLSGYQSYPIPTEEGWAALQRGNVRAVLLRVASPANLVAVEPRHTTIKDGLQAMKAAVDTTYVEATFGMGRGDHDMDNRSALNIMRWLWRERSEDRGGISKLGAKVIEDGSSARWLNLLSYHLGGNQTLDLPPDDPDRNFAIREAFVRQVYRDHLDVLRRLYDQAAM